MPKRLLIYLSLLLFSVMVPVYAEADFEVNLNFGMKNSPEVRDLQQFLKIQGVYDGPVTGNYLGLTREAVRAFQAREGIARVGVFGPLTRERANSLLARTAALRANLEEQLNVLQERVADLQQQLARAQQREVSPAVIEPRSLVALNCFYTYLPSGRLMNVGKGSGVIVRSDGVILTARHLVDLRFSHRVDPESVTADIALNSAFHHCEVGQIPPDAALPDATQIQDRNAMVAVPNLPYEADLMYLPTSASLGVSPLEASHLDFALLRINGLSQSAESAGVRGVPNSFPTAKLFHGRLSLNDEVLTYGYPAGEEPGVSFRTFRLAGGTGRIKALQVGDLKFADLPIVINTEMTAQHGRSGSPLFYRGFVAGVVTAHAEGNENDSFSVSIEAILPILRDILGEL